MKSKSFRHFDNKKNNNRKDNVGSAPFPISKNCNNTVSNCFAKSCNDALGVDWYSGCETINFTEQCRLAL